MFLKVFLMWLAISAHACATCADMLVLGTDEIFPRSTPEGTGFEDLILKEAFRRIGMEISTVFLPSERALINADEGIDDGVFARIEGLESKYPNLVMVPAKLSTFIFAAFTRDPKISIADWEDLAPYNVGIVNGWQYPEQHMPRTRSLRKVREDETLFLQLMQGRIDVAVHGLIVGELIIRREEFAGIVAQRPPLGSPDMFLYLNKRHGGIVPKLTEALLQMDADGSRQGMIDKVLKEAGIN